ncbi:MAG: AAA family ATPase [Deltaproteobacteria bacterium]|nr:AAA family ATPase [Deltaproteobacteria bacterium]
MLRSLQIENFKCFGSPAQTVRLAPLTLLFGQNNAGKSTILQSLLLLRQSLDSAAYRPQLSLNGACFGGGSFRDVVHRHDMRREVRLVLQFDLEDKARSRVDLAFDAHEPDPPRLSSMELTTAGFDRMAVKRGRGHGGPYELWIGDKKQGGERAANFSFLAGGFLPIFGDEPPMRGRPSERRRDARSAGRDAIQTLAGLLLGMRAVGPFRRSPERRYEHTGPPADRLDVTGAHAVEALVHDALSRRHRRAGCSWSRSPRSTSIPTHSSPWRTSSWISPGPGAR